MTKFEELQAELKRLQDERSAFEAAEEALAAEATTALQEKVEEAARDLAFAKLCRETTEKHGKRGRGWDVVRTTAGTIAVRKPNVAHFRRFTDTDKPTSEDIDRLVRTCLITPVAEYDRICEDLGAAILLAGNVVTRLAGFTKAHLEGK